jgi:hypothetical protein
VWVDDRRIRKENTGRDGRNNMRSVIGNKEVAGAGRCPEKDSIA